ncbi:dynactin p62 family-domain-containing protein, partial [Dimargaris cristalligena]
RCARNCFECPRCFHNLLVVEDTDQLTAPPFMSSTASSPREGSPYYLQCTLCRWSSRDIGMAFEKQTGLAGQMQKLDQFQAPLREFDHLKSHLESMLRTHQAGLYSSSTRGLTALNQPGTDASSGPPTYEALHHSPEDDDMVNELMNLRTVDDIATVAQRVRQSQAGNYLIRQHAPQRVALRSKRSKRCRGCRHILIKPEQKAQVTRFKIKFIAMNFVPTITIVRNPILYTPQRRHRCAIRFVNPQYHETRIQLAIPDDYPNRLAQVTILAPSFDVSAYNDIWEYDQNQDGGDDGGSDQDSIDGLDGDDDRQKRLLTTGIYDRKANETAIVLEVTPLQPVPNLIIPLHVSFNYTLDNLTDDEGSVSDSEPDSKAAAGRTDGGSATAKAKGKPNLPRRECGFWTYLNLGRVE